MRATVDPSFPLMARSGAPDCAQVQSMSHAGGAKEDSASEEMIRGNQPHSEASRGSQGPSASEEIQIELDDGADHLDAVGTSQTPETPGFRSQLHGSQLQLLAETTVEWPALVVAGRVVLLHGREGSTRAVAGDSRLPTLRRVVVSQRAVSDHNMDRYAMALRSVWRARGHVPTTTPPVRFAPARTPTGQWKACNVCGSDVIWVCAFGTSDASLTTRTQASAPACMHVLTTAPSPPHRYVGCLPRRRDPPLPRLRPRGLRLLRAGGRSRGGRCPWGVPHAARSALPTALARAPRAGARVPPVLVRWVCHVNCE